MKNLIFEFRCEEIFVKIYKYIDKKLIKVTEYKKKKKIMRLKYRGDYKKLHVFEL